MPITLNALARWLAAGGLWLVIVVLIIPTLLMHWASGVGLFVIAELKAKADELLATD